jgi:phage terminase large subunit
MDDISLGLGVIDESFEAEIETYLQGFPDLASAPPVPPLGSWLPYGMHDSAHDLADAHAQALLSTRRHRQEARIAAAYPETLEAFIDEVLGMELTDSQREIVRLVQAGERRIAVKSCHGSGKTRVLAAIVIAFLHINKFSKVVTTGPGGTQLKEGLWQDIRYLASQSRRKLLAEPLTTKWELAPGWFALGYKPSENKATRLQGIHAPRMLLVVDEAAEVEDEIYGALASLMTSEHCTIVMIGNPTKREGPFYRAFTSAAHIWHRITIKAKDTPNVQLGYEKFPGLITREWIADTLAEHGDDSDYARTRIEAEFPLQGDTSFIPADLLEAAHNRRYDFVDDTPDRWEMGVDVARYGNDKTVATIRNQGKPVHQEAWGKLGLMETVGRIRSILEQYPPMKIKVDAIGLGAGVADRLREEEYDVVDITVSQKSTRPEEFLSVRDELWWNFRQMLVEGYICGPIPAIVQSQMTSIRFKYDSRHTKPVIEGKSSMKDRGLDSPDEAESFLLAFVEPEGKRKKPRRAVAPVAIPQPSSWIGNDALGPEPSGWGESWPIL